MISITANEGNKGRLVELEINNNRQSKTDIDMKN